MLHRSSCVVFLFCPLSPIRFFSRPLSSSLDCFSCHEFDRFRRIPHEAQARSIEPGNWEIDGFLDLGKATRLLDYRRFVGSIFWQIISISRSPGSLFDHFSPVMCSWQSFLSRWRTDRRAFEWWTSCRCSGQRIVPFRFHAHHEPLSPSPKEHTVFEDYGWYGNSVCRSYGASSTGETSYFKGEKV